MAVSYRFSIF